MVVTVVGITARRTNVATVKAGAIVMTVADLGAMDEVTIVGTDTGIATNIVTAKKEPSGSFFMLISVWLSYNPSSVPISSHRFSATTSTTIIHPIRLTSVELTKSPISD